MFTVTGVFCSWGCVKAHCGGGRYANLVTLLRKKATGVLDTSVAAPTRYALDVYGGPMSIQEFRAVEGGKYRYSILPDKMIIHQPVVTAVDVNESLAKKHKPVPVDFTNAVATNEPLRLKRPKPLAGKPSIEKTLGFGIFADKRQA
jgi:hypothetical protein